MHRSTPPNRPIEGALLLIALAWGGGGCAANEGLEKDVASLRTEVASLRAREGALTERLEALERAAMGGGAQALPATIGSDRPDLEVVRLTPPAPETSDDFTSADGRIRIRSTAGGLVEEDTSAGGSGAGDFKKAKEQFEKKSWDAAIASLTAFIAKNPRDANLPEATHLRGMAYAVKNDPGRAAEQFEAVVESYPDSSFAPDALLELARVRDKMGDKGAADKARARIKADYPKSAAAKKLEKR